MSRCQSGSRAARTFMTSSMRSSRLLTEKRPMVTMRRRASSAAQLANLPTSAPFSIRRVRLAGAAGGDAGKQPLVRQAATDELGIGKGRKPGCGVEPELLDGGIFRRMEEA